MKNNIVLTTCAQSEAESLAEKLVEDGLVACVNIIDKVQSAYRWQGKIVKDHECLLVMKSSSIVYDRLQQRIKEIHSYEVPEIISLDIENGYAPYLEWLNLALK
jgi:periplasmic divalent cation tolerance protein